MLEAMGEEGMTNNIEVFKFRFGRGRGSTSMGWIPTYLADSVRS